jgi:hypothetical protein
LELFFTSRESAARTWLTKPAVEPIVLLTIGPLLVPGIPVNLPQIALRTAMPYSDNERTFDGIDRGSNRSAR